MVHEPPGFRRFVEARYSSLVRFGVVLCGDLGRGEDLTQAALVKTLHAWNRQGVGLGDPEGHTRAVMAQQAWRTAHRRRGGAAVRSRGPGGPGRLRAGGHRRGARVPHRSMPVRQMRSALAALPAQQRVVLVLRYLVHLSDAEIASELRCSTGTVRNRVGRAVTGLRGTGLLDETVGGEPR